MKPSEPHYAKFPGGEAIGAHQASLDLGLPVLAVVDNLDDRRFVKMDREIVDARMYLRALDQEPLPNRKLADAVGAM